MADKPKPKKTKRPEEVAHPQAWEDEGDSHSCTASQAYQFRYHQHSNGTFYEQCRPLGGGTWGWRVA